MERYGAITAVSFGPTALGLPISVRLWRRAEGQAAGGDSDAFVTSVQLGPPAVGVEVRIRDTAAAEALAIGQAGVLSIDLAGTASGQAGRTLSISAAVLVGIELHYEQAAPAVATLTFLAEAPDGDTDPFAAEDSQP